jgi:hypothetical protein
MALWPANTTCSSDLSRNTNKRERLAIKTAQRIENEDDLTYDFKNIFGVIHKHFGETTFKPPALQFTLQSAFT